MIIILTSYWADWLFLFHLVLFLTFCLVLSFGVYSSVSPFCLTLCIYVYKLGRIATSKPEGMVLCMVILCVDHVSGHFGLCVLRFLGHSVLGLSWWDVQS